jgi:hypothetical protein
MLQDHGMWRALVMLSCLSLSTVHADQLRIDSIACGACETRGGHVLQNICTEIELTGSYLDDHGAAIPTPPPSSFKLLVDGIGPGDSAYAIEHQREDPARLYVALVVDGGRLTTLPPSVRASVAAIARSLPGSRMTLRAFDENLGKALEPASSIAARAETLYAEQAEPRALVGIRLAIESLRATPVSARRLVIVLSDGTDGLSSAEHARQTGKQARANGIVVHALAAASSRLSELCHATGGTARTFTNGQDLVAQTKLLMDQIKRRTTFRFVHEIDIAREKNAPHSYQVASTTSALISNAIEWVDVRCRR